LAARRHGLIIRPLGDSILFVPPIAIQADEVKHLVRSVRLAMDDVLPNLKTTSGRHAVPTLPSSPEAFS
jgi:adenosylmethionine-8-amino-7-oxononanoate aminotransferase